MACVVIQICLLSIQYCETRQHFAKLFAWRVDAAAFYVIPTLDNIVVRHEAVNNRQVTTRYGNSKMLALHLHT